MPYAGTGGHVMTRTIVVINSDTSFLTLMRDLLTDEGYAVHTFIAGTQDFLAVQALAPDVIILDIRLEHPEAGWNPLEFFRLEPHLSHKPIIVCSADLHALQERALYL